MCGRLQKNREPTTVRQQAGPIHLHTFVRKHVHTEVCVSERGRNQVWKSTIVSINLPRKPSLTFATKNELHSTEGWSKAIMILLPLIYSFASDWRHAALLQRSLAILQADRKANVGREISTHTQLAAMK